MTRVAEFPRDGVVAVGFGVSGLYRDGECIVDGEVRALGEESMECLTGEECESIASSDPCHKWEIIMYGPLSSATYERSTDGRWIQTSKGEGFA